MRLVAAAVVCLTGIGCGQSASGETPEVTLRVSAGHDLNTFIPGEAAGGAAYALHLVYEAKHKYIQRSTVDGPTVRMQLKKNLERSSDVLANSLRFAGLMTAYADGNTIVAEFETAAQAERFGLHDHVFALGRYRLSHSASKNGKLVLESRRDATVDLIEIVSVPEAEEWRRLSARDVDVVPATSDSYLSQFENTASVRTVPLDVAGVMALRFNTEHGPFADAAARHGLARAVSLSAIGVAMCGTPRCRGSLWSPAPDVETTALPTEARLIVLESDTTARTAARHLKVQLERAGLRLTIEPMSIEGLPSVSADGFDLVLAPLPNDPVRAAAPFVSTFPQQIARYSDSQLDEAHASGDVRTAMRILAEELPALPIYELRMFAAIDERFCGGDPSSPIDWGWLADLRLCDEE